ncbi:hypothetical protein BST85_10040 [Aureitalea marina]|uniref:Uncharacterized protein n=2 Tax=Aureitalea marina TaxID=930804 RepID=A0A2S7KRK2_9FLAO|nr:hypothetical protein BST85_10040 [Aureitalea marina]
MLTLLTSCSSDDDNNQDQTDLAELIQALTDGSSKTWSIESASLSNQSVDNLSVTSAFNAVDDEYVFIANGSEIELKWIQGFGFNPKAENLPEFLSDNRVSSSLSSLSEDQSANRTFQDQSGEMSFQLSPELNRVNAVIRLEDGAIFNAVLKAKTTSDYATSPVSIDQAEELFSFAETSIWSGFRYSGARNSLYASNSGIPEVDDPTMVSYDISTNKLDRIFYPYAGGHPSMHLELYNETLFNLGGIFYQTFDLDLQAVDVNFEVNDVNFKYGSAAVDDALYLFGGYLNDNQQFQIAQYDTNSNQVNILESLDEPRYEVDGEIVDNVLYIFGGFGFDSIGSNKIEKYDIDNANLQTSNAPFRIGRVRTAIYQHLIYLAGAKVVVNGDVENTVNFIAVFNTKDQSFKEIELNVPEWQNMRIANIQVTDDSIYTLFHENLPGPNGLITHAYQSPVE